MLPSAESACFAIADISGYTHFVSGVELDHAQDIIADIMDTLVRALRPPFRLAKFEGDAAFVYALAGQVDGSLLQDSIEHAYFAFRRRLRNIKQANSCACQACSRMHSLDVKFVVHHGEFIRQKMSGREELAGRDVILVHRLLKNDVGKTVRRARLRALFRRLRAGDGDRRQSAGPRRAFRGDRAYRRNEVLGPRPRAGVVERKRGQAQRGRARRRDRGDRDRLCGAPRGGLGPRHHAGKSPPLAGKRQRGRKHGQGPARRRHAEPLHARQGGRHRGHPRLAPVRAHDLHHPAADPGRPPKS